MRSISTQGRRTRPTAPSSSPWSRRKRSRSGSATWTGRRISFLRTAGIRRSPGGRSPTPVPSERSLGASSLVTSSASSWGETMPKSPMPYRIYSPANGESDTKEHTRTIVSLSPIPGCITFTVSRGTPMAASLMLSFPTVSNWRISLTARVTVAITYSWVVSS